MSGNTNKPIMGPPLWLVQYGVTLGTTLAAVLLRWGMDPWLGNTYPLATLFGAIAVAVWIGGWRCAALATILGYFTLNYLFIPPRNAIEFDATTMIGFVVCLLSAVIITILGESMRGSRSREQLATQVVADQASASYVQQARMAAIVESSDDAIIAITPDGVITSFNHGAERIFGYSAEEVVACPLSMLLPADRADEFPALMERLRHGERSEHYETVRRRKDGSLVDLSVTLSPLHDSQGKLVGASKVARDISERKQNERRLAVQYAVTRILAGADVPERAIPEVLRSAVETLNWSLGALWVLEPGSDVLHCTAVWSDPARPAPKFEEATRQSTFHRGIGLPGRVWETGQPSWIEDVINDANFPRAPFAAEDGLHAAFAFPIIVEGETLGVMEFFTTAILPADENLLHQATSIGRQLGQFISRKNAARALLQSEARKAAVLEASLDGIITIDHEGRVLEFNPAAERMFGYPREQAVGRVMAELVIPPSLRENQRQGLSRYLATGDASVLNRRLELTGLRADGVEFPVELTITRLSQPGPAVFTAHVRDITERTRAEEALRESQERFAAFMRHLPGAAWMKDLDGRYVYANPDGERIFDTPAAKLLGRTDHEIFPRETADQFRANDLAAMQAGSTQIVEMLEQADGVVHHSIVSKFAIRGPRGEPQGVAGVAIDVTERLRAEQALRDSEQRLRLALRAGRSGVWDWDIVNNRVTWSDYLYELHGIDRGAFGGTVEAFAQLIHPEDRGMVEARLQAALESKGPYELEFRIVRPNGKVRWIATNAQVMRDKEKPVRMFGVTTDITERKKIEAELAGHRERLEDLVMERTEALEQTHQRLRQSERMAAMGTLAAGIGHDMGNLLLPVRARVEALQSMGLPVDSVEHLTAIANCAVYLQNLAEGLRLFSLDPEQSMASENTDLHAWRAQVEPFFRGALPRAVTISWELPDDVPPLVIARHALTQAVYNLVQNAGDALRDRDKGLVHICAVSDPSCNVVRLSVIDNGPGMSEEVRSHCLEPFFTTKPRSISTGMGLSLVHRIVQRAGGSIDIGSKPGHGAAFTITLPALAAGVGGSGQPLSHLAAAITVRDPRIKALLQSVLRAWRIDIIEVAPSQPIEADIWITESRDDMPERTTAFLRAKPAAWCLMFEGETPVTVGLIHNGGEHERIVVIKSGGGLSHVQAALRKIVTEATAHSAPASDAAHVQSTVSAQT